MIDVQTLYFTGSETEFSKSTSIILNFFQNRNFKKVTTVQWRGNVFKLGADIFRLSNLVRTKWPFVSLNIAKNGESIENFIKLGADQ